MLGPTVQRAPLAAIFGVWLPAEFRSDDDLPLEGSESLTHKFFIEKRPSNLSGMTLAMSTPSGFVQVPRCGGDREGRRAKEGEEIWPPPVRGQIVEA